MSVKAKAPKEDPETKARRLLAEQRAEAGRLEELGENVSEDTAAIVRRFGRISGNATGGGGGAGSLFGGGSGGFSGGSFRGFGGENTNNLTRSLR